MQDSCRRPTTDCNITPGHGDALKDMHFTRGSHVNESTYLEAFSSVETHIPSVFLVTGFSISEPRHACAESPCPTGAGFARLH